MTIAQPRSREEAKLLGLPDWQIAQMFPQQADPLALGVPHEYDAPNGGLLAAQDKPAGFWQGGDKFRARDGIAGLLAAIGDGLTQNSGGQGYAVQGLLGGRLDARKLAEKKAEEQAQLAQMMAVGQANGLTPEQVQAQALGLKLPEQEKPPGIAQNYQWWNNLPAEEKQRFAQYQDVVNPKVFSGQDGLPYRMPRGDDAPGIEDGYQYTPGPGGRANPQNWKPAGGGTGNGVGGF